jgi:hypothetical protein
MDKARVNVQHAECLDRIRVSPRKTVPQEQNVDANGRKEKRKQYRFQTVEEQ